MEGGTGAVGFCVAENTGAAYLMRDFCVFDSLIYNMCSEALCNMFYRRLCIYVVVGEGSSWRRDTDKRVCLYLCVCVCKSTDNR